MSLYYYLNPDHSVRECTLEEWADQFEDMCRKHNKHVASDIIKGNHISTVWLGSNHNYYEVGKPLIFETMIFEEDSSQDIYCARYSTWDEAIEGHKKAIEWVLGGCNDESE
jgi:hypothetical protein